MSTKRLTKRELREDPAIELVNKLTLWAEQNGRQLLIGLGVAAVVVALGLLLASQRKQNEALASEALLKAEFQMGSGDLTGSAAAFQDVINRYGGTPSGHRAVRDLADAMFYLGRNPDAIKNYQTYLGLARKGTIEEQAALMGIAASEEQSKDYLKAAEAWGRVADRNYADEFGSNALWSQGRCYAMAGQFDKAAASYDRLIHEHPRSRYLGLARQEMAEVQARAQK